MSRETEAPDWVVELPENVAAWARTLASDERPGLCRACVDAEMPFDFPSSGVVLGFLQKFAGYVPDPESPEIAETKAFVQECQDAETGFFIDPCLDPRFEDPDDAEALRRFRAAVTKYTIGLLHHLGAKPLHPFVATGKGGVPDPEAYVNFVRTADWSRPWGTGSHAAGQTRELFFLANEGHDEYLPYVREGMEFILSQQNPETGMWGPSSIPLSEQISGTLKVLGAFQFSMGFSAPYLDRLADSCIRHHADRSFYEATDDQCVPRNVVEMCVVCIENSDYRREELLDTLASLAEYVRGYRTPDGAFSSIRSGMPAIGWCGATICGPPEAPRGNVNGTQAAVWCLGMLAPYLGWNDLPLPRPRGKWRENVAAMKYRIEADANGRIDIARR